MKYSYENMEPLTTLYQLKVRLDGKVTWEEIPVYLAKYLSKDDGRLFMGKQGKEIASESELGRVKPPFLSEPWYSVIIDKDDFMMALYIVNEKLKETIKEKAEELEQLMTCKDAIKAEFANAVRAEFDN